MRRHSPIPEKQAMTAAPMNRMEAIKRSITLAEVGVIISLICTIGMGVFTLGVVYGQVKQNERDIASIKPKVDENARALQRIDANVTFLTQLATEERARRK
jgi:hypothetical protein